MRSTYRVFAYLIAALVMVQAAAIALGVFGLFKWVDGGGNVTKAAFENGDISFPEDIGFAIHGMSGMMLIPAVSLIFLILSFFAKIPGGVKWAAIVLLTVVVQVLLGMFAHGLPALGALHGLNALILFGVAVMAGKRVATTSTTTAAAMPETTRV